MSSGLMSCVRENSPPLEFDDGAASSISTIPNSTNGNGNVDSDQQKRRRFHPLRNLRRIFRRRTLTAVDTIPKSSSSLNSIQSFPSSPLSTSQLSSSTLPTVIASVPAHNLPPPYRSGDTCNSDFIIMPSTAATTAYSPHQSHLIMNPENGHNHNTSSRGLGSNIGNSGGGNYGGVQVLPPLFSSPSGFYKLHHTETNKNRDKTTNEGGNERTNECGTDDLDDAREMTDHQRSLSEGRLVDSDFNKDGLSQSHDSVFSESATASSLSIVLKAELFDVLRKRRNRPDASDEDLGLPRSPTTPQRKDLQTSTINTNQSEVSSLSLLSMASTDLDDESSSNYGGGGGGGGGDTRYGGMNTTINNSFNVSGFTDKTNSNSYSSSKLSSQDTSKVSDEFDFDLSGGIRLSHAAAKHKMAIRPKKKGPSRHRKPIESTALPSTPEVNEDFPKTSSTETKDFLSNSKHKSQPFPPTGIKNRNIEEQHTTTNGFKSSITKSNYNEEYYSCNSSASTLEKRDDSFFRRLLHRNSKKMKKQNDETDHNESIEKTTFSMCSTKYHTVTSAATSEKSTEDYNQKIEETRKEIRKELYSEGKSNLSAMLNTFILSPTSTEDLDADDDYQFENDREDEYEREVLPKIHQHHHYHQQQQINRPKSGPAARQRILPKEIAGSPLPDIKKSSPPEKSSILSNFMRSDDYQAQSSRFRNVKTPPIDYPSEESPVKYFKFSNEPISQTFEVFHPIEVNKMKTDQPAEELMTPSSKTEQHYEKKERPQPKIVGLSSFQQKISSRLSDTTTLSDTNRLSVEKPRKPVEKSKSFRYYSENMDASSDSKLKKHENMPSLPDLSFSSKYKINHHNSNTDLPSLSLSFEINDNQLLNKQNQQSNQQIEKLSKKKSSNQYDDEELPLSHGIYTKNIILTTSKPSSQITTKPAIAPVCNQNITEIEENIDKLVKSPFITVLRKPNSITPTSTNETNNNAGKIESKASSASIALFNLPTAANARKTETVIDKDTTEKTEKFLNNEKQFVTESNNISKINNNNTNEKKAISTENLSKPILTNLRNKEIYSHSLDPLKRKSIEQLESIDTSTTGSLTFANNFGKVELRNKDKKSSMGAFNCATAPRRNSSVLEKFENGKHIPEFMKIQLNRVDPTRPKSNIVLSKNTKESTEEKEINRHFSTESIDLTENPPTSTQSSPTNIDVSTKRTSYEMQRSLSQEDTEEIPKSPSKKINDGKLIQIANILKNTENTQQQQQQQSTITYERKKSVADEKLKYEKKIEELRSEWKIRSASTEENNEKNSTTSSTPRKHSIDDETGVVLRKKSFSSTNTTTTNNKEDTPELMKVFARRSLKLKDEEMQAFDDIVKSTTPTVTTTTATTTSTILSSNSLKKFTTKNMDSDKENQSSSEEKLDKLPKVEITIQQQSQQQQQQQQHKSTSIIGVTNNNNNNNGNVMILNRNDENKNRNSSLNDLLRKTTTLSSTTPTTVNSITPIKSSYISPIRYSTNNFVGYRNNQQSNFNSNVKNVINTIGESNIINNNVSNNNNHNNNNNHYHNNTNNFNNNNSLNKRGLRHTIGPTLPSPSTTSSAASTDSNDSGISEFKGIPILQRRAEWEKRAQEALKQ